jgi:Skp family chaperone for outer membrane proteins
MATEKLDTSTLRIVEEEKLRELQAQQDNLKKLQEELSGIKAKLQKKETLTQDEIKYIGELGWLSALAVTIAALANSI